MAGWSVLVAAVSLVLWLISPLNAADGDAFHEMSLARELVRTGAFPVGDPFAFTPTHAEVIHHEWGAGLLFYLVADLLGAPGFMALRLALIAALLALCVRASRRGGAPILLVALCIPPAWILGIFACPTIRAQLLTCVFTALLLNAVAQDREGDRRWLWWWPAVHVVWLNVHAGFVIGLMVLGLYGMERLLRRERVTHLLLLAPVLVVLILVNPWGTSYVGYLAKALPMDRTGVSEWASLLEMGSPSVIAAWALLAMGFLYAWRHVGWRGMPGFVVVAALLFLSWRQLRHVSLFAVVWLVVVPPALARTPLWAAASRWLDRHWKQTQAAALLIAFAALMGSVANRFWDVVVPGTLAGLDAHGVVYPVGPVEHLRHHGFKGNVYTPFTAGGFVMWKLHPQGVKISYDGRLEVAYPRSSIDMVDAFWRGEDGWDRLLREHQVDALILERSAPVVTRMAQHPEYRISYLDGFFLLFVKKDHVLPSADGRGVELVGTFP